MRCHELRDLVPDFLTGDISEDELGRFQAHLADCDGCRSELEQVQSLWRTLGELSDKDPGPGLRGRFYAMLEGEKRRLAKPTGDPWPKRVEMWLSGWWPRRPAVQVALAAALLIVGMAAGSGLKSLRAGDEVAQLRDEVQQMYEMVSLSLLKMDSSSDRLRGVNWSSRVSEPSQTLLTSLSNTLRSDDNANVRLAAVDALGRFGGEPGVVDVLTNSLSRETSPTVQVALIDLLIAIQEKKALEALRDFIQMQNLVPEVREYAEDGLSVTM